MKNIFNKYQLLTTILNKKKSLFVGMSFFYGKPPLNNFK